MRNRSGSTGGTPVAGTVTPVQLTRKPNGRFRPRARPKGRTDWNSNIAITR